MKLTGESVECLCEAGPNYKKLVTVERGKKVIYVKLKKALYGCALSALLWYELFSSTLQEMGFELNNYDACVANREFDGKQCTITWYVDDLKVAHVKEEVVQDVIDRINKKFEGLVTTSGKNTRTLAWT